MLSEEIGVRIFPFLTSRHHAVRRSQEVLLGDRTGRRKRWWSFTLTLNIWNYTSVQILQIALLITTQKSSEPFLFAEPPRCQRPDAALVVECLLVCRVVKDMNILSESEGCHLALVLLYRLWSSHLIPNSNTFPFQSVSLAALCRLVTPLPA